MEQKLQMDDLEAFVLDFLAYRREQKRKQAYPQAPPKLIEYKHPPSPNNEIKPHSKANNPVPYTIGKGWPHYKDIAQTHISIPPIPNSTHTPPHQSTNLNTPQTHSDIIPTLTPMVTDAIIKFGNPTTPKALNHLVCQVIATAMANPLINESINSQEIAPWGRVPLLHAVIELLITLYASKSN